MKTDSKEYLLCIIGELKKELLDKRRKANLCKAIIGKEKEKLINSQSSQDTLWKYRFRIKRLESDIKRDKAELRKYEKEFNRRFNPGQPPSRKLLYDKEKWKEMNTPSPGVLKFYQEHVQKGCLKTRESTIQEFLQEIMDDPFNTYYPNGIMKYLKARPGDTKIRLYYSEGTNRYYHLIEIL